MYESTELAKQQERGRGHEQVKGLTQTLTEGMDRSQCAQNKTTQILDFSCVYFFELCNGFETSSQNDGSTYTKQHVREIETT